MNKSQTDIERERYENASILGGHVFDFQDGKNQIILHNTLYGRERIYYNDDLVANKLMLTFKSSHKFIIDDHTYELRIKVISQINGNTECTLLKDGNIIGIQEVKYSSKSLIRIFVVSLFIGLGAGYFFAAVEL